jgi:superoxide dismutase, Cu-Zn family
MHRVLLTVLSFALAACAPIGPNAPSATAQMVDASGQKIGQVRFQDTEVGTRITVRLIGLTPGRHGTHVHLNASCANTTDQNGNVLTFGGAGGHFDPMDSKRHGKPEHSELEAHAGDVLNTTADANTTGTMEFITRKLRVSGGTLSVIGHSVIVHASEDDHNTQPTGNSGGRVACGVILKE